MALGAPAPLASVLEVKRASLALKGLEVVADVSLHVAPGECVAVMAPSGAGKSTLLRIALGLEVLCVGTVVLRVPSAKVGVVFQSNNLFPWLTVAENMEILGDPSQGAENGYIERYGLGEFTSYFPRQLSGGMQQKVALCRLLRNRPEFYVVDEGLSSLDELARLDFCDALRSRVENDGNAMLLVTHSLFDALHLADRIVVGSARPIKVKAEFENPLPRGRNSSVRFSSAFEYAVSELRKCLA